MNKLLLSTLLTMSVTAASAQPWTVGQEITDQLEWGNLSFENNPMDYWTITLSKGSTTQSGGLFEVYDGADVDLFQYVKLPAGIYRVECQAYYRFGTSWDADPNAYGTSNWQDLAQLYVKNGTYDIDSEEFLESRTFSSPVMPRLFDYQEFKIYDMTAAGDESSWDMSDGEYGDKGWGPCSVPGSLMWFNAGKYMPKSNGDVTYNSVQFFIPRDGYVKLGISKVEAKEADSFMATNFKMYYEGESNEEMELAAMRDDVSALYTKIMEMADENPGLLYTLLTDALFEFEDEYDAIDELSKEECETANDILNALYMNGYNSLKSLATLKGSITGMKNLANSTEFSGKADFLSAISKAEGYVGGEDFEISEEDDFDTFQKAYDELIQARNEYLKSQEAVDGMYDYTAFVNNPWFCLPEYEPTFDKENNTWVPNEAAMNTDSGDGTLWADKDDVNGTINNIAAGINVYGKEGTPGQWAQYGTEGGSLEVYWNDLLTCVKKWDMPHAGYHYVSQLVTGIPNGYYKMKALAQTWTNDWSGNCQNSVFIKSSTMESYSENLEPGGWWGKNINQWLELETGMIQVTDGQVTIGSRDNGFAAFTGFRLYYFGETPDFVSLLKPQMDKIEEDKLMLTLPGDIAQVDALVGAIPTEISDQDTYVEATELIAEINAYIAEAIATMNSFTALEDYAALLDKYEDKANAEIVTNAWSTAMETMEKEDATYLTAQDITADYNAYAKYVATRNQMIPVAAENAELKAVLDDQAAVLKSTYANAEQIATYLEALAAPYNKALIASLGGADASEANPVDLTSLIVNPDFAQGKTGWEGDFTADGTWQISESWNTKSFSATQTIMSLPAGAYEIQAQSFYRDGGSASDAFMHLIYDESYTPNCKLIANEQQADIVSLASEMFTETAMPGKRTGNIDTEATETYHELHYLDPDYDPDYKVYLDESAYDENGNYNTNHPFDQIVVDDQDYFYVNSIEGSAKRFAASPNAYINKVKVYLPETMNLTFGVSKPESTIGGDWCIFDNFKLYYIGQDVPTSISAVSNASATSEIFTVAGVKASSLQKGINVVKYSNGTVKKVFVK